MGFMARISPQKVFLSHLSITLWQQLTSVSFISTLSIAKRKCAAQVVGASKRLENCQVKGVMAGIPRTRNKLLYGSKECGALLRFFKESQKSVALGEERTLAPQDFLEGRRVPPHNLSPSHGPILDLRSAGRYRRLRRRQPIQGHGDIFSASNIRYQPRYRSALGRSFICVKSSGSPGMAIVSEDEPISGGGTPASLRSPKNAEKQAFPTASSFSARSSWSQVGEAVESVLMFRGWLGEQICGKEATRVRFAIMEADQGCVRHRASVASNWSLTISSQLENFRAKTMQ
ncbi:hypothetical protein EI94DRAFT_1707143 [Lactarius quietus]|nr:hypothetical protein EI94DRAFT_1707143 [Lactarius quietus]